MTHRASELKSDFPATGLPVLLNGFFVSIESPEWERWCWPFIFESHQLCKVYLISVGELSILVAYWTSDLLTQVRKRKCHIHSWTSLLLRSALERLAVNASNSGIFRNANNHACARTIPMPSDP